MKRRTGHKSNAAGVVIGAFFFLVLNVGSSAVAEESTRVNDFFDRTFDETVDRFPEWQTSLGIKKDYGKWNEHSDEADRRELEHTKKRLAWLTSEVDVDQLDPQTKISYQLSVDNCSDSIKRYKYRRYTYPVNQMFGRHTGVPSFLINMHRVEDASDAEAYLSRLQSIDIVFDQLIEGLKTRELLGVVPPQFVYPRAIESCRNIITGAPFDASEKNSTLLEDFKKKVEDLDVDESRKAQWLKEARTALSEIVEPSYTKLILFLEEQSKRATKDAGVWKFKDGDAFYTELLRRTTTTDLTADEIHEIGLREVARIKKEMQTIMRQVKFEGDLQAFFNYVQSDSRFFYPDTDDGRQAYLDRVSVVIDEIQTRVDTLFLSVPEADLEVKQVEAFREKSAGMAFYNAPAPDGSRPGIYYLNLYDMKSMAKYKLEALAYHEAIPGHHMQLSLAQQLEGLPKFRKYGGYAAYTEGWGLYCELLPKEIGLYTDPYSDFGRLNMELFRACRLVVDTGIHAKRWSREEGIAYYQTNTPETERDCVRMVERHIVLPAQATAYKVGMLKILELRKKVQHAMGDTFDIREFHDVILSNGAVPLDVLEQLVDEYIASKTRRGIN